MTFGKITEILWSLKVSPKQQQTGICVGQEDLLSQSKASPFALARPKMSEIRWMLSFSYRLIP
jgi:hypothetical protein